MTWSARIVSPDGNPSNTVNSICSECQHVSSCHLHKMAGNIGAILTSIDVGCDGHMASGDAELKCNGFERIVETSDNPSAA